jgi:glycosyltransferase involved in cell wall biosynthesis
MENGENRTGDLQYQHVFKNKQEMSRAGLEYKRLKNELQACKIAFSYQLGSSLIQAIRKPGLNTLLFPEKLVRITYQAVKRRRKIAKNQIESTKPLFTLPEHQDIKPMKFIKLSTIIDRKDKVVEKNEVSKAVYIAQQRARRILLKRCLKFNKRGMVAVKAYLDFVRELCQQGLWEESEYIVKLGISHYPDNQSLLMAYAEITMIQRNLPDVKDRIQSIVESSSIHPKIYGALGEILLQHGFPDEADAVLKTGTNRYPKVFELSMQYSKVALARKDWLNGYKRLRLPFSTKEARLQISAELPLLEYGAINEGVTQWGERWKQASPDHRVLMVVPKDFAGSMYKLAEAMNRYTPYAVRMITFEYHQFDYPVDLVVPECDEKRLNEVYKLANEAAVFHLKDEHSWYLAQDRFPNLVLLNNLFFSDMFPNKPKVFTHYGGYARKLKQETKYVAAVQKFSGRIAMTPDLNYEWFNGEYVPHAIDTDNFDNIWKDVNLLAHSPSTKNIEKKATDMFKEAVDKLEKYYKKVWCNWSFDIIHGVSYKECLQRKCKASLFFDQAGWHGGSSLGINDVIGWYGNSAIEAMAFGIPTIAHLSKDALERAKRSGFPLRDCPVINVSRSSDALVETILSFIRLSPKERRALAERTRQFAIDFHGYKAVGERMSKVYDRLLVE